MEISELFSAYFFAVRRNLHQLPEHKGLERVGYHDGGGHADEGAEADASYCGMLCEEQGGYHDDEDDGGEKNGHLMPRQKVLAARACLGQQALGDEDAVVDSHTKDERGDDDINEVELQSN